MKKNILFTLLSSLLLVAIIQTTNASQADLEKDINYYAEIFSGNNFSQQRSAMEKLGWAGISSPRVYDSLADKLVSSKDTKNKEEVEKASWYAKALALSGNEKYRPLLSDISQNAKSSKLRKYSKKALIRLDKYIGWNPTISQNLTGAPTGALEQQRIKNMLGSKDLELVRLGAKRVYHAHSTELSVVSVAAQRLEQEVATQISGDMRIDTVAWLIKGIGRSGEQSYKNLLQNIFETNKNSKVRKYAKKALQNF